LITSAPKSDSTVAAAGAAMKLAQSRTLSPSKMPFSISAPFPSHYCSCRRAERDGRDQVHLTDVGGGCNCSSRSPHRRQAQRWQYVTFGKLNGLPNLLARRKGPR